MKRLPLKAKFALGAAVLTAVTVVAAGLLSRPIIYRVQLKELDNLLSENAQELFRDLENFRGAPSDFRKPITERFIPVALRRRYLEIEGPEQQVLYRSANLRGIDLAGASEGIRTISLLGQNARIGSFKHGYLTLHIGTRLGTIEDMQAHLWQALLWTAPASAALVAIAGWLWGRWALKPVEQLINAAELIDAQHPEERLPMPPSKDEIARLTEVLNRSFDRLQAAYLAAQRFSADASHQLKTPLAVLRAAMEEKRGRPDTTATEKEELNDLLRQTRRLTSLVDDLLLLAQADAGRLQINCEPLNLPECLALQIDDLDALCSGRELALAQNWEPNLVAQGDNRRLAVIFQNLAENAVKYSPAGGTIEIKGARQGEEISLTVKNGGVTIPIAMQSNLFERFNRAGRAEDIAGHGLGLNIARELARAQGGEVSLDYSDERGTCFSLRLKAYPT